MVVCTSNPSTGEAKAGLFESDASMVYTVNSRTTIASTEKPCLKNPKQNKTKQKQKHHFLGFSPCTIFNFSYTVSDTWDCSDAALLMQQWLSSCYGIFAMLLSHFSAGTCFPNSGCFPAHTGLGVQTLIPGKKSAFHFNYTFTFISTNEDSFLLLTALKINTRKNLKVKH